MAGALGPGLSGREDLGEVGWVNLLFLPILFIYVYTHIYAHVCIFEYETRPKYTG